MQVKLFWFRFRDLTYYDSPMHVNLFSASMSMKVYPLKWSSTNSGNKKGFLSNVSWLPADLAFLILLLSIGFLSLLEFSPFIFDLQVEISFSTVSVSAFAVLVVSNKQLFQANWVATWDSNASNSCLVLLRMFELSFSTIFRRFDCFKLVCCVVVNLFGVIFDWRV